MRKVQSFQVARLILSTPLSLINSYCCKSDRQHGYWYSSTGSSSYASYVSFFFRALSSFRSLGNQSSISGSLLNGEPTWFQALSRVILFMFQEKIVSLHMSTLSLNLSWSRTCSLFHQSGVLVQMFKDFTFLESKAICDAPIISIVNELLAGGIYR